MDIIDWDESFRIGVEQIDRQHKKLFALRNQLFESCCTENSVHAEKFHSILSELFEYTRYHFEAEEELMQAYFDIEEGRFIKHWVPQRK